MCVCVKRVWDSSQGAVRVCVNTEQRPLLPSFGNPVHHQDNLYSLSSASCLFVLYNGTDTGGGAGRGGCGVGAWP